jgi:hypothetical protein
MAVRSLLHYALEVPDQTVGEKFSRSPGHIRDPRGSFAEYPHDLDDIPEPCAREPRDVPEAEALYRWGPPVPDDFGVNRELEG